MVNFMNIPNYQMHNVLNVYSKQFRKNNTSSSNNPYKNQYTADKIKISVKGKREAIIEKISAEIVHNILRFSPEKDANQNLLCDLQDNLRQEAGATHEKNNKFVFNIIDNNNNKITSHIAIEDSAFLLNRLKKPDPHKL